MFTSESVTEGHPDKLCDQISDAILDHILTQDPYASVRAECAVSNAIVFIAARFSSTANIDFTRIARKVINSIGYDQPDFNATNCSILTSPQALPVDDKQRFNEHELSEKEIEKITVKNQVTLFGYACDQTETLMPLPIWLANKLALQLAVVRKKKMLPYLLPDGKVQVGIEYKHRRPQRIHGVTIATDQIERKTPKAKKNYSDIIETVVEPVLSGEKLKPDNRTVITLNPDGPYPGGPSHHSGLTGRKNAVDTYGQFARLSEKALSGKDPLRIDRIGAYAARHAAKNVVAAGLAAECEIMLSYSIGQTRPVSLQVQSFGTNRAADDDAIAEAVKSVFDFRLAGILRRFDLRQLPSRHLDGFYQKLAAYGHFGRTDLDLPWEKIDKAEALKDACR